MDSGVCFITNNFNGLKKVSRVDGDGIFEVNGNRLGMEGTFRLNESLEKLVGTISFEINDIVHGNNQDILLFSYDFTYKPLGENKIYLPNFKREIWYLKLKTGLTPEEERFLRDYNRMSHSGRLGINRKFEQIQEKIEKNIIEERERIMHILNDEKGHGGGIELFK